jgi:hypothetical protein
MGFTGKTRLASGLCLLILGHLMPGHAVWAGTIEQNKQEITIFVYNSARVSVADLALAERQASMIFREAGIATGWVNCLGGEYKACRPSGPTQFVLHIVAHGKTSTNAVFGLAFLGTDGKGRYCNVFYDRIEKMEADSGTNAARLLGTVAAHEIGHLLLGSQSHSAMGLMSAHWGPAELRRVGSGGLKFTTEQAGHMRVNIDDWQRGEERLQAAKTESSE